MFNFIEVNRLLTEVKGVQNVGDEDQLATLVISLLKDKTQREAFGAAARKVVEKNRGAVEAHVELVNSILKRS